MSTLNVISVVVLESVVFLGGGAGNYHQILSPCQAAWTDMETLASAPAKYRVQRQAGPSPAQHSYLGNGDGHPLPPGPAWYCQDATVVTWPPLF